MNLLKFDDIIIWSYDFVYSKKFSSILFYQLENSCYKNF